MKNKELVTYIKSIRKSLKLSQAGLAELIGSNRANIANYESGRAIPPGDVLLRIQKSSDKSGASAPTGEGSV